MRSLVLAIALVFTAGSATGEAQAVRSEVPSALLTAHVFLSDFGHAYIPARTPRRAPPLQEPRPKLTRGINLIAAGAGLTLGAVVGMTALRGRRFRCGDSQGYTFWPGGLVAGTGLLVSLAGWGERSRVPVAERKLEQRQRIGLPFVLLGSALVGVAPMAGQALFCEAS